MAVAESLELIDTVISDQAASNETHNVKIAGEKVTKTQSNFSRPSAQTGKKHTTMTFIWFPDHVLWYNHHDSRVKQSVYINVHQLPYHELNNP